MATDHTERVGIDAARLAFSELGWFPKEAERPDYGVDLFVETAGANGRPSGRLFGVQVKSGSSYIAASGDGVIYPDQAHIDYWKGYSIPVIVTVYDPKARVAYWQIVSDETIERTCTAWKVVAPRDHKLDGEARAPLAAIAEAQPGPEGAESALTRLRADLTWMQVLEQGGSVELQADECINKTSGRGELTLISHPADGSGPIEGRARVFLGLADYSHALPRLFPWADLQVDEEALDANDEEEWMDETGIWDSEDKCYIGNTETFAEWRASRYPTDDLRPSGESAGEVAHWRLSLGLNELGRAVLALERYLAES